MMIQINKKCKEIVDGPVLTDVCDRVRIIKHTVRSGKIWEPELFPYPYMTQMILFLDGKGYVTVGGKAFNIIEPALLVPEFERQQVCVYAVGEELKCLQIISHMNEEDCNQIKKSHMVFPRFRLFTEAWEHTMNTIDIPCSNTRAFVLIENRKLGANNMGIFRSEVGVEARIGEDCLPTYDQFVVGLEGADCILFVGNDRVELTEGDIAFIPRNTAFHFQCDKKGRIHHVWFSLNRAYDE